MPLRSCALGCRWVCKLLLPICLAMVFSPHCDAQDFPRWELSGAFTYYLVGKLPGRTDVPSAHGPQVGLAYSINKYFRIESDFYAGFSNRIIDLTTPPPGSIHYNDKLLVGLIGPEFVLRRPNRKLSYFAHYLTGVGYAMDNQISIFGSPTGIPTAPTVTATSWMNSVGGGVDLNLGHQVSFRMLQADWMRNEFPGNPHTNWRFVSGFVLRLGEKR